MGTTELDPNGDITTEWNPSHGGVDHFTLINEGVPPLLTEFILCTGAGMQGNIDTFDMETVNIAGGTITSIEVKVYSEAVVSVCSCIPFTVDINIDGWQGAKNYNAGVASWQSQTWAGLEKLQGDLDDLQIKFTSGALGSQGNCVDIHDQPLVFTMYVVVIWEDAPVGYTHDVMGVSAENIDNVSGVPTANIDKIKGV